MRIENILTIVLTLIVCSCHKQPTALQNALDMAGENGNQLTEVINFYQSPKDSLKLKAAYYLIENMPGKFHYIDDYPEAMLDSISNKMQQLKNSHFLVTDNIYDSIVQHFLPEQRNNIIREDIKVISTEILIENIEMAFYVWENLPWTKGLSFDYFCEYILPYKCGPSKPELGRKKTFEEFKWLIDSVKKKESPLDACILINDHLKKTFEFRPKTITYNYSQLCKLKSGDCLPASIFTTVSMRAIGIPVKSIKTMIAGTPPHKGQHTENIVLTRDLKIVRFQGSLRSPNEEENWKDQPRGKWYAELYKTNNDRITAFISAGNNRPSTMLDNCILDITRDVTSAFNVKVELNEFYKSFSNNTDGIVYLCVSTRKGGWAAIDYAKRKGDSVQFTAIQPGLVYFPMYYKENKFYQCANPFFLSENGKLKPIVNEHINLAETQTVKLTRKYPLKKNVKKWAANIIGCSFQAANDSLFTTPKTLHVITDSSLHIMSTSLLNS